MTSEKYIGLDVGGSFLKGARVDSEGQVEARLEEAVAGGSLEALVSQLASAVSRLGSGAIGGVGVGLPGIVDRDGSRVRVAPNLPVLDDVSVAELLCARTGSPTVLENDANAAALAESWLGAGRDASHVLFVTLGTGVGGGLVLGGRILRGAGGYAGEIGHIQVEPEGIPCGCGSWGCLETVAGAPGWVRRAEQLLANRGSRLQSRGLSPKVIAEAAAEGDGVALEVVTGVGRALGIGIAAALDLLNLERVVIGGGVARAGALLLDRVVEESRRRLFARVFADCSFRLAELGAEAGVVGAARVAMLTARGS